METINNDNIKAGDFLIIGFGKGTQGVKVIGTSAKRLEIIRCQQYLSDNPFWTGTISKISRNDRRILRVWNVPNGIASAAPDADEIASTKEIAKHKATLSKLINQGWLPLHDAHRDTYWCNHNGDDSLSDEERAQWAVDREASDANCSTVRKGIVADYAAKHGRNEYGGKISS